MGRKGDPKELVQLFLFLIFWHDRLLEPHVHGTQQPGCEGSLILHLQIPGGHKRIPHSSPADTRRAREGTSSLKHIPSVSVFPCAPSNSTSSRGSGGTSPHRSSPESMPSPLLLLPYPFSGCPREPWREEAASSLHRANDAVTVCIHILTAPW